MSRSTLLVLLTFAALLSHRQCRHQTSPNAPEVTTVASGEDSGLVTPTDDPVRPNMKRLEAFLKNFTSLAIKRTLPSMYRLLETVNVSSGCMTSLLKYAMALKKIRVWAMRMFDATAKLPAGMFGGTVTEIGAFDQCLKIQVRNKKGEKEFQGQYCSVEAIPTLGPRPDNLHLALKPVSNFDDSLSGKYIARERSFTSSEIMAEIRSSIFAFYKLTMRFGVCVPSTCSAEDLKSIGVEVVKPLRYGLKVSQCQVLKAIEAEPVHVVILCLGFFIVLLLCAGSFIDLRRRRLRHDEEKVPELGLLQKILVAFSVPANYKKLISNETAFGEMRSLHGIRALSMTWVILGHTYIWVNLQSISQTSKASEFFSDLAFEVVLNGWLSVTSFIFLSGLLTAHTTLAYMKETRGKLNVLFYVLRRVLRIYPSMLLVLGSMLFLPWLGSGPFWEELPGAEVKNCRTYWWTNLLFINNFRPIRQMCMQHSWYLSADMQLHVLALIVLLPMYRNTLFGLVMAAVLTLAGTLAVAIITYVNNYDPTILISTGNVAQLYDIVEDVHIKSYSYIGAYCVGVVTGYLLLRFRKIKISVMQLAVGWCAAAALSLSSLYGLHPWNTGWFPGPLVTSVYAALHRTTFVVGLSWLAFVCTTGNSPMVSSILTCRPLVFISRLTFLAYLAQGPVIWTRYGSMKERMYFSHFNMLYEYVGNLILSLAIAFVGYLAVEAPFANLERLLFFSIAKVKSNLSNKAAAEAAADSSPTSLTLVKSSPLVTSDAKTQTNSQDICCRTVTCQTVD